MNDQMIFFSYSRADTEEFALKLANDLTNAGANVWIDQLHLKGGENYNRAIEKALKHSTYVLLIVSERSIESEYVLDEVHYAIEEKKSVIPIITYQCKLPFRLRGLQQINFINNYEDGLKRLLVSLSIDRKEETELTKSDSAQDKHKQEVVKWICASDNSHVFDEDTNDHFCPLDPPYHGLLLKTTVN